VIASAGPGTVIRWFDVRPLKGAGEAARGSGRAAPGRGARWRS
jgi:hypothetical protein